MDKKKIIPFLRFLNVKLDEDDLKIINADDAEPETPESETPAVEAQAADEGETLAGEVVQNAFPPAAPAQPAAAAPPAAPAPAGNLPLLDQLITDIGGFEAFKAVLLKVVEAGQGATPAAPPPAPTQNEKRAELISKITTNSKGMNADDLASMDEVTLEKVFGMIQPLVKLNAQPVDYGALSVTQNDSGKQTPAPRPVVLFAMKQGEK